jgi:hypothetical protein
MFSFVEFMVDLVEVAYGELKCQTQGRFSSSSGRQAGHPLRDFGPFTDY